MYREVFQTDLSEFHSTVWEKSPKVSTKLILLCYMAIIAILLYRISLKNSPRIIFLEEIDGLPEKSIPRDFGPCFFQI